MTHVIDSSALLAVILKEPGADQVLQPGRRLHLSVVNLAEVYTKIAERGGSIADTEAYIATLPVRIHAFLDNAAIDQAAMRLATMHRGLSMGDRICLSLAKSINLPVLTADKQWAGLDIGVDIRLIR